jgi:hypothetical protein
MALHPSLPSCCLCHSMVDSPFSALDAHMSLMACPASRRVTCPPDRVAEMHTAGLGPRPGTSLLEAVAKRTAFPATWHDVVGFAHIRWRLP